MLGLLVRGGHPGPRWKPGREKGTRSKNSKDYHNTTRILTVWLSLWGENKLKVCGKWIYNIPPSSHSWTQFLRTRSSCSLSAFASPILRTQCSGREWLGSTPSLIQHLPCIPSRLTPLLVLIGGRFHQACNFICAHISRDDLGSWRFVDLLQSYASRVAKRAGYLRCA